MSNFTSQCCRDISRVCYQKRRVACSLRIWLPTVLAALFLTGATARGNQPKKIDLPADRPLPDAVLKAVKKATVVVKAIQDGNIRTASGFFAGETGIVFTHAQFLTGPFRSWPYTGKFEVILNSGEGGSVRAGGKTAGHRSAQRHRAEGAGCQRAFAGAVGTG